MQYQFKGKHILAEFYNVDQMIADENRLRSYLTECCNEAKVNLIGFDFKLFDNGGYTLCALLKESHITIHTYPEYDSIFLDVFTCGKSNTLLIVDRLAELYRPLKKEIHCIERGNPLKIKK